MRPHHALHSAGTFGVTGTVPSCSMLSTRASSACPFCQRKGRLETNTKNQAAVGPHALTLTLPGSRSAARAAAGHGLVSLCTKAPRSRRRIASASLKEEKTESMPST